MFLRGEIFGNEVLQNCDHKDTRAIMLVCDKGDSYGLTPFRNDFIDNVK